MTMTQVKTVIIAYALAISIDPASLGQPRDVNPGLRAASWKFVQRVICIGTRGSAIEPRVRYKVVVKSILADFHAICIGSVRYQLGSMSSRSSHHSFRRPGDRGTADGGAARRDVEA